MRISANSDHASLSSNEKFVAADVANIPAFQ